MSITIEGVPETISRDDYLSMIGTVGFDVNTLRSLRFGADCIEAEVIVRNPNADPAPPVPPAMHDHIIDPENTLVHKVIVRVVA